MAWTQHRLKFRLLSPLHVGCRKVGNLMQTRPYVPGKLLWAALTARLTRDHHDGRQGREYQRIGDLLHDHFRFGYLWPSVDGQSPCLPWGPDDFDYLLRGSYASTALDYGRQAAQEGALHETEFIAPTNREDGRPVYLLGDLWVRQDSLPADLDGWQTALAHIQLGGERGYGWGRVRLESGFANNHTHQNKTIAGYTWQVQNNAITLSLPVEARLTAHAVAVGDGAVSGVIGPVEPLVGWERQLDGRYGLTRQPLIAYTPGSLVAAATSLRIGSHGLWEAAF